MPGIVLYDHGSGSHNFIFYSYLHSPDDMEISKTFQHIAIRLRFRSWPGFY